MLFIVGKRKTPEIFLQNNFTCLTVSIYCDTMCKEILAYDLIAVE